ncbi:MAG: NADP-dependent isocitrate dehydrogenase [Acidobacteria bacterium]|nr:MAG: NADP-dependent isocitrate dehydrogenase [Acidobacteriota bacterium]
MALEFNGVPVPAEGSAIDFKGETFIVPHRPIIPYIEGDGTGRDIWKASRRVFDAAVEKVFRGERKIVWYEVFAGEKAFKRFGEWLPQGTLDAIRQLRVAIKGPLTTPVGGGIRSLNVALRQLLNLYACWRPVKYVPGVPSPVRHPERMNIVIFRENTEDVYAGIEWREGSPQARRLIDFVNALLSVDGAKKQVRADSGIGIKPISITGTKQLVRRGLRFALDRDLKTVTLVHKGNIMKFTEGSFRDWGYQLAKEEFRPYIVTERESWILDHRAKNLSASLEAIAAMVEPGLEVAPEGVRAQVAGEVKECLEAIQATHGNGQWKNKVMVNDRIADSMLQQIQTRADEYQVLCTPNLNGDYLSDACAAQIGGLGVAPGANIGDGYGIFEATHGTAPKYADQDVINPGAVIRSGALMFEFVGWPEVGALIERAFAATIAQHRVTYDLERLMRMEGITDAVKLGTGAFAGAIIENMSSVQAQAV